MEFATTLRDGRLYSSFTGKGVELKVSRGTCHGSHSDRRAGSEMANAISEPGLLGLQELRPEGGYDEQRRDSFQWEK